MRIRTVLFIIATVILVAFALLNWQEFTRPTELSLGFASVAAPLGLILLGLLVLAALVFMAAYASTHTRHLVETRQHAKALQAQRDLADRAEGSRFVELREHLDEHLRESRQRETQGAAELEQAMARIQRELRQQGEQLQRGLAMRLGEMEARLTGQLERLEGRREPGVIVESGGSRDVTDAQDQAEGAPRFDRIR